MDPGRVEAPAAAIEYARRLAQRGVPIVALVRAYRIGHARFLHWCFEELANEAADGRIRAEATRRMTELSFTYVDRASEQVIVSTRRSATAGCTTARPSGWRASVLCWPRRTSTSTRPSRRSATGCADTTSVSSRGSGSR